MYTAVLISPRKLYVIIANVRDILEFAFDRALVWDNYSCVNSLLYKGGGKGAENVGKSAGGRVGKCLRCYE